MGDSTRIIAAIDQRWPRPPLYPEDETQRRRALELEEYFDEELGPHTRRGFYHEMLPHPDLLLPRFTHVLHALLFFNPVVLKSARSRYGCAG